MHISAMPLLVLLALASGCDRATDADYVAKAEAHLNQNSDSAALVELKNALALNPENTRARWLLGEIHLEYGRYEDAAKELALARKLGISDDSVLPLLARAWRGAGELEQVKALQVAGLGAGPRSQVLAAQAAALLADGDLDGARSAVQQAVTSDPGSAAAITEQARLEAATGDAGSAVALLEGLGPDHGYAPAWALLGDLQKQSGQLAAAEASYGRAIELRRANTTELLKRGLLRVQMGNYADARSDLGSVKKLVPKHFEANYGLGLIAFLEGRHEEALPLLETSVAENEQFMPAVFYLAATHLKLGDAVRAENLASRVVATIPNSIPARKLLAQIRYAEGAYDEVAQLLKPVVSTTPEDAGSLNMLAAALVRLGEPDEAYYLYEKLAGLQPGSAQAQLRLGAVQLLKGAEEPGLAALARALELDPDLAEAYQVKATYFARKGEYDRALEAVAALRDARPASAAPATLEGQVRLLQGEHELARKAFEQARAVAPDDIPATLALATLELQDRNYGRARTLYEALLQSHPDHLDTIMRLAMLDELEGKPEQMASRLSQAISAHPKALLPRVSLARYHLSQGRPDQVPVALGELLRQRQDAPALLEVHGMAQLAQGDTQAARATFSRLAESAPRSAEAHYLLAQALSRLNDGPALKAALERVLQIDADHLPARIGLARVLLLQGKVADAEKQLEILESRAPDNPDVISLRAAAARLTGDDRAALDAYSRVFREFSTSTTMLALARQRWASGEQLASIALMEKWVTENPDDRSALLALASAYSKSDDRNRAVAQYQLALDRFGDHAPTLNNLAWLLKEEQPRQALDYAERAARLAPGSAAVLDTHAMVLSKNGQHARAQRVIERAVQLAPQLPVLRYHSAVIDAAAGESARARETLSDLLGDNTDFPERQSAERLLTRLAIGGSGDGPSR